MPPPPSSDLASRLFLGPALRTQSDSRLVQLVHDGYENAFEEIVRRYGKSLVRYAAAIVPFHRADDVTQDAFSKALLALRHSDKEIELRPWLYRIVRNTALNDIRDAPPAAAALTENLDGVETPVQVAERRAEIADVLERLRALPEPQRAAIVMRELEGLSHEEIAAQLGMTGGAARQTIYRARQALRNGAGFLIPVPALHFLLAPSAGGVAAGAGLGGAAGGAAASAGGAGAGTGLKAGLATVLIGGTVATGVALEERFEDTTAEGEAAARESGREKDGRGPGLPGPITAAGPASAAGGSSGDDSGPGSGGGGGDRSGSNSGPDGGSNSGPGSGSAGATEEDSSGSSGSGSGDGDSGSSGSGSSGSGSDSSGSGSSSSGSESSGSNSGPGSGSGSDSSGSGSSGSGDSGSGSDSSGSGSSGSGDPDFELDFD